MKNEREIGAVRRLIPKTEAAERIGVVSRTLSRWTQDDSLAFPRPVAIRHRLYFWDDEIAAWAATQDRTRTACDLSRARAAIGRSQDGEAV